MYQILSSLHKREWRFIGILSLVLMCVTTMPLLYGFLTTDGNHHFTATHFSMPNDWFVYYAYITQGIQGHWLFYDLFTAEPHHPTLNIFWLIVGLLARILRLSPEVALNLVRIILIPIAVSVIYTLTTFFFSDRWRAIVTTVACMSSGLGVLLLDRIARYPHNYFDGISMWPIDVWVPESGVFTMLHYSPHFIASFILIVFYFIELLLYVRTKRIRHSVIAAISAALLFAFHPFHVPMIFAVTGVYFLVLLILDRQWFKLAVIHGVLLILCSAPAIGYYMYLIQTDWVMSMKTVQNICTSPALWLTVVGYGLFSPLALVASWRVVKNHMPNLDALLLVVWAWVQLSLLYLPVNFQRRLNEGLIVPFVLLSMFVAYQFVRSSQGKKLLAGKYRFFVIGIFVLLCLMTSLFHLSVDVTIYALQSEGPHRITRGLYDASRWLATTPEDSVVLNSAAIGVNPVPAYSGRRVYIGHGVETPFWREKQKYVELFFTANRDEQTERLFLSSAGIDYILYSTEERQLGTYTPSTKSYLQLVYDREDVQIYKVQ